MADKHTKVVDGLAQVDAVLQWVYQGLQRGLPGGSVGIDLYRYDEQRNNAQNSKQWAMYADISNQLEWHGKKMSPEDWKILLTHEWKPQSIVPAIGGGFCVLNSRTSKASKREMADLIEIIYEFGSNYGIKWSEPALKEFEKYREANNV